MKPKNIGSAVLIALFALLLNVSAVSDDTRSTLFETEQTVQYTEPDVQDDAKFLPPVRMHCVFVSVRSRPFSRPLRYRPLHCDDTPLRPPIFS